MSIDIKGALFLITDKMRKIKDNLKPTAMTSDSQIESPEVECSEQTVWSFCLNLS